MYLGSMTRPAKFHNKSRRVRHRRGKCCAGEVTLLSSDVCSMFHGATTFAAIPLDADIPVKLQAVGIRHRNGCISKVTESTHTRSHRAQGTLLAMNVNFFEWLRDGVRQSVLLGVSDAIEQIGTPADSDDLHPNVAALLQGDAPKSKRSKNSTSRKRLGKSLKDMDVAPTQSS